MVLFLVLLTEVTNLYMCVRFLMPLKIFLTLLNPNMVIQRLEIAALLRQFSAFERKNGIDRQFQGRNVQVILPEGFGSDETKPPNMLLCQIRLRKESNSTPYRISDNRRLLQFLTPLQWVYF